MKDQILKGFLDDFSKKYDMSHFKEDEQFEHFVNFNVISTLYPREINIEELSTGGSCDIGIDGIAIIVNGNIIKDEKDIDHLLRKNGYLDVTFVLIQSKNQAKFQSDKVGTFIFGVESFFENPPMLPENENISSLRKVKDKIYRHSIEFESKPKLKLYFVTTGEWKEPEEIVKRAEYGLKSIKERNLFQYNNPEEFITFIDLERLKNIYRDISRRVVKEVIFDNYVTLPDISSGVNQSFIGSIDAKEFIELIKDSQGNISRGLFFDNVRDYQGKNKVNKQIENTIKSEKKQKLLPLLNNGITIIAKKIDRVANKMKLTDFQIVNGCQSSHVLFENRENLKDKTNLIVKVIETKDQAIIEEIVRATNSQTEVKDEAFESLKPFHKELAEYYKAKNKILASKSIFYERRSKEYSNDIDIKPYQIITLSSQIKSYISMVLEQPQSTHRYFGELLDSNSDKMFKYENREIFPLYYLSSFILNRLESMLKAGIIYSNYKHYKYHIVFLTYIQLKNIKLDNGNKLTNDEKILFVDDNENIKNLFIESCKVIKKTKIDSFKLEKDFNLIRSKEFTTKIKENLLQRN
ncbi:AIPR family protein [Glaesserella parasuis]|uniref:AIPR family protein n=1 Tax=Glaesserella parasuis TaxID=738 RepID=UPI002717F21B|nr:AIPR family protein [Glaesserella parasuis]